MARDDRRQHGTKIGRHSKIAAFVEHVRSEAGPLAVHPAALHGAAQYPGDIAVAVLGAAIAVLAHRAAEFGQHDNRRVPPIRAERFGERCEPVTAKSCRGCLGWYPLTALLAFGAEVGAALFEEGGRALL